MRVRATRLTAIASAVRRFFSPSSLFSAEEQGVWYDPGDLSTLFQDAAGTTPVTAVEQPVGRILDKSGRGNHATQTTSTSRPVLSARYNLLTKTEQFDDAAWVAGKTAGASVTPNTTIAPDGTQTADTVTFASSSDYLYQALLSFNYIAGQSVALSYYAKTPLYVIDFGGAGATSTKTYSSTDIGDGWYKHVIVRTFTSSTTAALQVLPIGSIGAGSYVIWGASLVPANQASIPYQRVNTATDYDADPAKFPAYLKFDGVDDGMVTNSIDFTGTDKMTVFAGVRKLIAQDAIVIESSNNFVSNAGSFVVSSGSSVGDYFGTRGSAPAARNSAFTPPETSVQSVVYDIAGAYISAEIRPRINGAVPILNVASAGPAGTGNYGNYPLYIGRRGGVNTLPFNGHIYSLIVRGAATTDTRIAQTERWVAKKTGVTL